MKKIVITAALALGSYMLIDKALKLKSGIEGLEFLPSAFYNTKIGVDGSISFKVDLNFINKSNQVYNILVKKIEAFSNNQLVATSQSIHQLSILPNTTSVLEGLELKLPSIKNSILAVTTGNISISALVEYNGFEIKINQSF